jgi:hypothetical protein
LFCGFIFLITDTGKAIFVSPEVYADKASVVGIPEPDHMLAAEYKRHPPPVIAADMDQGKARVVQVRGQINVVGDDSGTVAGKNGGMVFFKHDALLSKGALSPRLPGKFARRSRRPSFLSCFQKPVKVFLSFSDRLNI